MYPLIGKKFSFTQGAGIDLLGVQSRFLGQGKNDKLARVLSH